MQDVCFSDAFEEHIKVLAVGDETGLVQVASTAIAGGMVIPITSCGFVFQNKSLNQIDFESIGLLL